MAGAIKLSNRGTFAKTKKFLNRISEGWYKRNLEKMGEMGVEALSAATPVRTGATAAAWSYEIWDSSRGRTICWKNTNLTERSIPVVVLIYYGHATRNGGFVPANDFITPAIAPILDTLANDVWKEVTKD